MENEDESSLEKFHKASEELRIAFEEAERANEKAAEDFWQSLSYDDKCNAFHAVVSRIVQAELKDKGSYRYALYDVFEFGPEMYMRGMDCGYMALHNSIFESNDESKT